MITYHIKLSNGRIHAFPFYTREAAQQFRTALGGTDYGIFEKHHKVETEEEREERQNREFENEVVETELETGRSISQL